MQLVIAGLLVAVVVLDIIVAPLAAIWSLNTIFALAVPYTVKAWFAVFVLAYLVGGRTLLYRKGD